VISLPLAEILLLSVGLGFDAFSVALAAGAQGFTSGRVLRLSWYFGLFQFMMPIVGWGFGKFLSTGIGCVGIWAVFLLLIGIGVKMLREGIKDAPINIPDLSRGWNLLSLSIGTSLDALGVGFGFGLIGYAILKPAIVIGVVCAGMTIVGLYLGVRLYERFGHRAMILGGLILIGIGIKTIL
jgi:putative Mn2+ efflux pump MntP